MDLTVASQGGGGGGVVQRDYRKGNWNIKETMTLIEAKRMDDERRMKRLGDTAERGKPAELRWKWVEDYCWRNGCFRSQNQCNDKWDNLMRDFKKVREFERKIAAERGGGEGGGVQEKSYWRMEKTERKDNNLPSNMLPQIYEALVAVVERKGQSATAAGGSSGGAGSSIGNVVITSGQFLGQQHSMPSPIVQCQTLPSPAMLTPQPPPPASLPSAQPLPAVARFRHERVLGLTGKEKAAERRWRRRNKRKWRRHTARSRVCDIKECFNHSRSNSIMRG
ncbi:uncharacterized protein LOC121767318 isoform X3 [Salvia splendens]|uniref:uncharacterized protein LOC121767318 isoform X3 n=1 Tax=Salvia splendens TaxID=180675 RepID=UPI001C26E5DC|nr:uncharacterized protein LOC121767318 isoform X3 [Salvia splendens]